MIKLLTILFCCISFSTYAQSLNWFWATSGHGGPEGLSIATDKQGNIYQTGWTRNTLIFGLDTLNTDTYHNTVFIAKYSSSGTPLWVKKAPCTGVAMGNCIAIDKNDNIYITGYFTDTIHFNSNTLIAMNSNYHAFIVKYDSLGNSVWAKCVQGSNNAFSQAYGTVTDESNNIYVTGVFRGTAYFGNDSIIATTNIAYPGANNLFLAKYDSLGNVIWLKTSELADGVAYGYNLDIGKLNSIFLTGEFAGKICFGMDTLLAGTNNTSNIFLTKYDSLGNVVWAKNPSLSGSGLGQGASCRNPNIALDSLDNIYITGSFDGTITFGNNSFVFLGSSTGSNTFLAKYNNSGNVVWAKSPQHYPKVTFNHGYDIVVDRSNNVYFSGGFRDTVVFENYTFIGVHSPPYDNSYIIKYNSEGNILCAESLSGGGDDVNSMAIDDFDNVYFGGDFETNTFILGEDTLLVNGNSGEDIFVAKFKCNNDIPTKIYLQDSKESSILVYPNPTTNSLSISNIVRPTVLRLYDMLGKIVIEKYSEVNLNIDTTNIAQGIYTLVAEDSKGQSYNKVIVTK